jgi:hypothetical protein
MSKMAELSMEIDDLVEQGMTAKFIAATLNVPLEFVYAAIDARYELENQTNNQYYDEE